MPPLRKRYTGICSDVSSFFCSLFFHVLSTHTFKVHSVYSVCFLCHNTRSRKKTFINPKADDFLRVPNLDSVWIFIRNCDYGRGRNLSLWWNFLWCSEKLGWLFFRCLCSTHMWVSSHWVRMRVAFRILFIVICCRTLGNLRVAV